MEPLFNNVILKKLEEESEQQYGMITIPDMGKEKAFTAEVIAVGPGWWTATGILIPTVLKPGDKVVLPKTGPSIINIKGEDYLTITENNIIAKV